MLSHIPNKYVGIENWGGNKFYALVDCWSIPANITLVAPLLSFYACGILDVSKRAFILYPVNKLPPSRSHHYQFYCCSGIAFSREKLCRVSNTKRMYTSVNNTMVSWATALFHHFLHFFVLLKSFHFSGPAKHNGMKAAFVKQWL